MVRAVIELSRYIFACNLLLFVIIGYAMLRQDDEERKGFPFAMQYILIFLNHLIGSLVLLSTRQDLTFFFFPIFQMIVIFAFIILMRAIYPYSNRLLTADIAMLLSIGLLFMLRLSLNKSMKQFAIVSLSFVIALFVPMIVRHIDFLDRIRWIYGILGFSILLYVFVAGNLINGSKLSFSIGGISFQPSEFVKISFVLFLASTLAYTRKIWQLSLVAVLSAGHVLTLVASRDLGNAFILFITFVFMVYVSTAKKRYFGFGVLGGVLASVAGFYLFPHVQTRVEAWLDPWTSIDSKGYQLAQSLFAIGTGSWFGMGLDSGIPSSIPYVEQDFIFSALCEEYGVIFGICLIALCVHLFLEIIHVSKDCEDGFVKYSCFGLGMIYISQLFLTVGGNCKFIPLTGVTLPFISYGGSSVLSSVIMIALIHGFFLNYNAVVGDRESVTRHKQLNFAAFVYFILFMAVSGYLVYFVKVESTAVINNSYNTKRQDIIASQTIRGDIISADGKLLATTIDEGEKQVRTYPFGKVFSHVVGFATNGKMGIEKDKNMYLVSSNLSINEKLEDDLADEKHLGNSVYTTLDTGLQQAAFDALGVYNGAVIVTQPSTGKILAMVSKPDFDPNQINQDWEKLINDNKSSVLVNRVTQGLYPPGSTFKILTALEYIRENPDTYKVYHYQCNGKFVSGEDKIKCYHGTNHGSIDFMYSFAKSCNSSFANMGMTLDREKFAETLKKCYFDTQWKTDFLTKESHVSMGAECTDSNMIQTAIGQGKTQITPLHLAMITGAIANNGEMMTPYLVDRIETASGTVMKSYKSNVLGKIMTEDEALALQQLMVSVVEEGTGTRLKGQNYLVAGKTGSAEFNAKGDSHAWFTGFTYDTQDAIQITVIMEDAGSGGEFAVPVARRVLDQYYK